MRTLLLLACVSLMASCTNSKVATGKKTAQQNTKASYELVLASEVKWDHLNPKRGDLAPKAGTLWGDRKGNEPTGFLLKPTDGFSSPPHIHNISYRGIVIEGLIHNDDPEAANMWMPAGSFWTQPKGEVHITSAKGTTSLAYIEIEEGPYLVLPADEHFDSGERPVNVDRSNIVWLDASDVKWIDQPETAAMSNGPKVAFLWGKPQVDELNGTLIKLPAGFSGKIVSHGSSFRSVLIKGEPQYQVGGKNDVKILELGSYFASTGGGVHQITSSATSECVFYVRANGACEIIPAR
ncbi:DUF4437 domain-containing protein [Saccharicrinis sp. 156]|uniref:DUF4437 domain-containing protein n=1 Tax=Saccharicrinis sp. 156 TaxID=3417574 RepID=UPI003D33D659